MEEVNLTFELIVREMIDIAIDTADITISNATLLDGLLMVQDSLMQALIINSSAVVGCTPSIFSSYFMLVMLGNSI